MTPRYLLYVLLAFVVATSSYGQSRFRSGIFLHHSTGGCIWGPNGGVVSVETEIARYNLAHHFGSTDSVTMKETWWPSGDNEWTTWHAIFDNAGGANDIRTFFDSNPIIMIKSCFPSANMSGLGTPGDTLNRTDKTVANYKWHWRSIVSVMRNRPQNFFVVWTNAPQVAGATNASEAALSNAFCRWAKDTLAAGLDPVTGAFPKNVFVFDFFHLLAGPDGMLPRSLASGSTDSHPNASATALAAPELVKQVFDAALAYETTNGVEESQGNVPSAMRLEQNYPNPFNPTTTIRYTVGGVVALSGVEGRNSHHVTLAVYDLLGREVAVLVNEVKAPGSYKVKFDASGLASGVYIYRMSFQGGNTGMGESVQSKRFLLLK